MQDIDELNALRQKVVYGGYRNPLVEWTLSDEWLETPRILDSRGNRLARGSKHGVSGITFNECHGEIDVRGF